MVRVFRVISIVYTKKLFQALERGQTHRSRDLAHFAVYAQGHDGIITREPEVSHQTESSCQVVGIGHDRTSLERVYNLCGVKAEHFSDSETPDHLAVMRTSQRVGRIEEQ